MATNDIKKMPVSSYGDQYRRRVISDYWQPNGLNRPAYRDMQMELAGMSILGGPQDQLGTNPARGIKVGPLEEDYPVR
jgi:hypothetical protein